MRCFKLLVRSALVAGLAAALIAAQPVLAAAPAGGPAVAWRNAAADADIEQRLADGALPNATRIEFVEHIRRNRREAVERHTGK